MNWKRPKVLFISLGIGVFLLFLFHHFFSKNSHLLGKVSSIEKELQRDIKNALERVRVFQLSIHKNNNRFSCLRLGGAYCKGKEGMFYLYGENGNLLSQISSERGLNLFKEQCSSFPSKKCPFRVESSWRSISHNNRCHSNPPLSVSVRFLLQFGTEVREWKKEQVVYPRIELTKRAFCECEGKVYAYGECKRGLKQQKRDFASFVPASKRNVSSDSEKRKCPGVVHYDGEDYDVSSYLGKGEAVVEADSSQCVNGKDNLLYVCDLGQEGRKATWRLEVVQSDCPEEGVGSCIGEDCEEFGQVSEENSLEASERAYEGSVDLELGNEAEEGILEERVDYP